MSFATGLVYQRPLDREMRGWNGAERLPIHAGLASISCRTSIVSFAPQTVFHAEHTT